MILKQNIAILLFTPRPGQPGNKADRLRVWQSPQPGILTGEKQESSDGDLENCVAIVASC